MNAAADVPERLAFLSPCGWGNLGDAAIVEALIHGARRRIPGVGITGFTLNPGDTAWRHGVEAYTCAASSLPSYPVLEPARGSAVSAADAVDPTAAGSTRPYPGGESPVRRLLRRLPIRGAPRTLLAAMVWALHEPGHWRRSRLRLRGVRLLVVAGGGQLDALWGGPLGHPYALWRWGRIARSEGAGFAVASVGTGTLDGASRHLVLRALRLARYRSYRDSTSRELLRAPVLTGADPVVPDLAYGLPVEPAARPGGGRVVVGISPMNYRHPDHWPERDRAAYRRHIDSLAGLVVRLLERGQEVVIFTTDRDHAAVGDIVAAVGAVRPGPSPCLRVAATETLPALFKVLAGLDLVVAARLHGILLAHLAHRPTLAIAHERKVRTLMQDADLAAHCVDIEAAAATFLEDRVLALQATRDIVAAQIARHVQACRRRVEAQFDELLTPEVSPS